MLLKSLTYVLFKNDTIIEMLSQSLTDNVLFYFSSVGKYRYLGSSIECDGCLPTLTVSEKYRPSAATNGYTDSITAHSNYPSEPQESEWND